MDHCDSLFDDRPIYAIICGAIRNEFELNSIIVRLMSLAADGFIDGIILSTWKGEFDYNLDYKKRIISLGITIVESDHVSDSFGSVSFLNYARQAVQLKAAIDILPYDCFILKCRTDLSMDYLNQCLDKLGHIDLSITEKNCFNIDFLYKIMILNIGISAPFHSMDIVFFGHIIDIKKMILFESKLYLCKDLPADCIFFMAPFIHRFPIISDLLSHIKYWDYSRVIKKLSDNSIGINKLPSALNKFYAIYFNIVDSCYVMYDNDFVINSTVSFDDIFINGFSNNVVSTGWIKVIKDSRIIRKILSGDVVHTPFYKPFYEDVTQLFQSPNISLIRLTKNDLSELITFMNNIDGTNVLVENNSLIHPLAVNVDSIQLLFGSIIQSDDIDYLRDALIHICIGSDNYYNKVKSYLPLFRKQSEKLYNLALVTCIKGRRDDYDILMEIVKQLYLGRIEHDLQMIAEYPFRKFGLDKGFYFNVPATSHLMLANYYYSLYSLPTSSEYAIRFIEMMNKTYELNLDISNPSLVLNNLMKIDKTTLFDKELFDFLTHIDLYNE